MKDNRLAVNRFLFELWTRERNLVFPDTVRNEGVFYRNLARRDQPRDPLIRVGTMMLAVCFLVTGCFFLASGIGLLISLKQGWFLFVPAIMFLAAAAVALTIGMKLAVVAVFSVERKPVPEWLTRRRRLSGLR